jgi:hypothetical protein
MKTSMPLEDDRPLAIMIMWILAGLFVAVGIWRLAKGLETDTSNLSGATEQAGRIMEFFECLIVSVGFWVTSVVLDLLAKIERNTRRR